MSKASLKPPHNCDGVDKQGGKKREIDVEVNEGQAGGSEKSSIHEPAAADVELARGFGCYFGRICCYCRGKKKIIHLLRVVFC